MTPKNVASSNNKYTLLYDVCRGLCVPGLKEVRVFVLMTLGSQVTLKISSKTLL